ncbi:antitoxin VbhA family protein [Georgenia muralis]
MPKERISPEEQARREQYVAEVRHSTEMEGGRSDDASRDLQDRWARGEITLEELGERTRTRWGA